MLGVEVGTIIGETESQRKYREWQWAVAQRIIEDE